MLLSYELEPKPVTSLAPLSVRVTPAEREMLRAAAELSKTNLSDYIRRKAIEAAEMELLERHEVVIPAEDWERFEAWANSPPQNIPELRALAAWRPSWKE